MTPGETDPRRVYTADGKTLRQEADDSMRMLGNVITFVLLFWGLVGAAVVILLGAE